MAKYDWAKLKREYMLGDFKNLRVFAESKGIPYNGYFKKVTTGWSEKKRLQQDQKETKIAEKVTEQKIAYEIDRNAAHLAAGDIIMTKLNIALQQLKIKDKNVMYLLQTAATTLEKVQKSQRVSEGKRADVSLMESLLAVLEGDEDVEA